MNTHQNFNYDYIITGGGCAGLSLAMRMINDPYFRNKRILMLEQSSKKDNDRTWCFWGNKPGFFEDVVYRKWRKAWFHGEGFSSLKSFGGYTYKMIRGIDFYTHCHEALAQSSIIEVRREEVKSFCSLSDGVEVVTGSARYTASFVFNSILFEKPEIKPGYFYLLQHFKGWIVEADKPTFDVNQPTLMDFRVSQSFGTTFVYVMPLSATRALVEYTLFTQRVLEEEDYAEGLKQYIQTYLNITDYKIVEEELGVIPMTDVQFPSHEGRVIHLGTSGGKTKPSSGYTFRNIQHHSDEIIRQLKKKGHPYLRQSWFKKRFLWYDRVLLHMLHYNKMPGALIFTLLFKKNPAARIFRFLDDETTIFEEIVLLNTLPQLPFMRAGFRELTK